MSKITIIAIILVLFTSVFLSTANAEEKEKSHCWDLEANQGYEELIEKYPNDTHLLTLYALRIGLCVEIEKGILTIAKAKVIFENMRNSLVKFKEEEERLKNIEKKNKSGEKT